MYDLSNTDTYRTPGKYGKSLFPSLSFYTRLFKIIIIANRKAVAGKFDSKAYLDANWEILQALEKVGLRFVAEGINHIRALESPAVFIGNHMSSLETMTLAAFIEQFKTVVFIMKQELLDYPLFGKVTGARNPIVVGRENPREDLMQVLSDGKKKLSEGTSIVIFPQKTRTKYFDPTKFNTLGIKLAQKSDVNVVPVALLTDAWENGKLVKDFGKIDPEKEVRISFGEPFKVEGSSAEAHKKVLNFIKKKLIEWGREDLIVK